MKKDTLPVPVTLKRITERLPDIFPEGVAHRNFLVRDIAARTIFVMFYAGAVEGREAWIRPNQVARMTDRQSRKLDTASREAWIARSLQPNKKTIPGRWYADNTREPIRDETIRFGFVPVGAVIERGGLPTTSSLPRYALRTAFAALFTCSKATFVEAVKEWQAENLTAGALARLELVRRGIGKAGSGRSVSVTLPNGSVRRMSPGPSSVISKAVIEVFAATFLEEPGVVFLSESRNKVVASDDELARAIGLDIEASRLLPDIILVDLGPKTPLLVFVEVVAKDGPITEARKTALMSIACSAGFQERDVAFVTALLDRAAKGTFRKVSPEIAWGSFVWFAGEPEHIVYYDGAESAKRYLHELRHGGGHR